MTLLPMQKIFSLDLIETMNYKRENDLNSSKNFFIKKF